MIASLTNRVFNFKIYGAINQKLVNKVQESINSIWLLQPELIAVSIRSQEGSIVQAKSLAQIFHNLGRKTGAPVYCFAEDFVMGSALMLLCSGNKCFANTYSLFGDTGQVYQSFGLKHLMKDLNLDRQYLFSGANKVKLNMFEDLKPSDVEWIKHVMKVREEDLKDEIMKSRMSCFVDKKININDLQQQLFDQPIFTARHAHSIGIIDGIEDLDSLVHKKYHGMKVLDVVNSGILNQINVE